MQFHRYEAHLMGSKVKAMLIGYLLRDEALSGERETAKLLGVSNTAVNRAVKELHEQNLVSPTRIGTALVWTLNKDSYAYEFLGKLTEYPKHNPPLKDLKNTLMRALEIIPEVKRAIIYGSIAEGMELPNSDIDLFLSVEGNKENVLSKLAKLNIKCLHRYGNNLSPYIFTGKDLKNPKNKKLLESINQGILVFER